DRRKEPRRRRCGSRMPATRSRTSAASLRENGTIRRLSQRPVWKRQIAPLVPCQTLLTPDNQAPQPQRGLGRPCENEPFRSDRGPAKRGWWTPVSCAKCVIESPDAMEASGEGDLR